MRRDGLNQIHFSQMFELWSFPLLYPEVCWKKDLHLIFLYLTSTISVHKKQKIRVLISVFIKQHTSTSCSAHLQRRTLLREIDTVLGLITSQHLIIAACHDSCISGGSTAAGTDVTLFSSLSITVMITWDSIPATAAQSRELSDASDFLIPQIGSDGAFLLPSE